MDDIDKLVLKKPIEEYTNTLYPVGEYFKQAATYISKQKNISKEEALEYIKTKIDKSKINDPMVSYNFRKENGDVEVNQRQLTEYIKDTIKNNEIIVPSFTTYYHPDTRKSLHADFLFDNVTKRSKYKKAAFKNKQDGNADAALYNDTMQKTMKIFNNSVSGAYASKSTILHNYSAHYTLTSITRCVSSIGNAVSESFLAGNKYFKSADIVINYITAIITNLNKKQVNICMEKYNLHYPTPNEALATIKKSSELYWNSSESLTEIHRYLSKLDKEELAAVVYTNDFWHLKEYNDQFLRDMIKNLSKKITGTTDDSRYMTDGPDGVETLVKIIYADEVKGMNLDYTELKGSELMFKLASTAKNIIDTLQHYKLLFRTFYLTDILPIDMANIKHMMRDVIVLSDTDSTCGSYDAWVEWYYGKQQLTPEAISIAAVVMTLNGAFIDHGLKILSKNMNVSKDRIELLKMKNEFYWSVFTITNVNKHYFAQTLIQEGNIYKIPELELKGVHLIGSTAEQNIIKKTHDMIKDINNTIANNQQLDIIKYINLVKDMEKEVLDKIKSGDISIFKKDRIKEATSYSLTPDKSPYFHHLLWTEVFADRYGDPGEPIYMVIKIPTTLDSAAKTKAFIESIDDTTIKDNLIKTLAKYNKNMLGTFRPPLTIVTNSGIPKEMLSVIDKQRIIIDNLNAAYIVLEALGVYRRLDKILLESI